MLENWIFEITRIPKEALRGQALSDFNIQERLSWAEERHTTENEDKAYCLLGLCDVFLPLIYGEGVSNAMRRLLKEIEDSSANTSQLKGKSSRSCLTVC